MAFAREQDVCLFTLPLVSAVSELLTLCIKLRAARRFLQEGRTPVLSGQDEGVDAIRAGVEALKVAIAREDDESGLQVGLQRDIYSYTT